MNGGAKSLLILPVFVKPFDSSLSVLYVAIFSIMFMYFVRVFGSACFRSWKSLCFSAFSARRAAV